MLVIYVAESSEKGGTWSGVMDGLRKGRTIYVRKPHSREKNANNLLISKGAKAVDIEGNLSSYDIKVEAKILISEPDFNNTEEKIIEFLKTGVFPAKKIVDTLKIDWSSRKVTDFLKGRQDILTVKGKPLKFAHKNRSIQLQKSLFE